jgi:hypothetical protein
MLQFPHLVGQHREESFWRTPIWNADKDDQYPAPAHFGQLLPRLEEEANVLGVNTADHNLENHPRVISHGEPAECYKAFVQHAFRKTLFHYFQRASRVRPPKMEASDLICILLGAKMQNAAEKGSNGFYFRVRRSCIHPRDYARRGTRRTTQNKGRKEIRLSVLKSSV